MSTRSQIDFVVKGKHQNGKKYEDRRRVYRHSDGYPDGAHGVIAELKEFLKWNKGRNADVEYAVANFIYWSKRKMEEDYFKPDDERNKWSDIGSTNCSVLHIGFGVCNTKEFHGDIEYWYEVINEHGKSPVIKVYEAKNMKKPIQKVVVEVD